MLSGMRKSYDAAFKAKVAFEAAKGDKTIAQLASEYSVHPNQIRLSRKHLIEQLPELFSVVVCCGRKLKRRWRRNCTSRSAD